MKKIEWAFVLALLPIAASAADGQVLINQASVAAAGGFPYAITQAGSYKLSGNLVPPNNVDAIRIASNSVTLDLNGFTIGFPACAPSACGGTTAYGITGGATEFYNVTIRNGTIAGMGSGVKLTGDSFTFEDLHIRNTVNNAIHVNLNATSDPGSVIVRRSTFDGSGGYAVVVVGTALITDNAFSYNTGGVYAGNEFSTNTNSSLIARNTFYANIVDLALQRGKGGYQGNVFNGNVLGGVNLGGNLCRGSLCP